MVSFFPELYPEELLYSACARYDDRTRYPNRVTAIQDLFGSKAVATMVDLPFYLDNLISALPPSHNHTADEFIDSRTLFPYYAPFLPAGRASLLRHDMRGTSGNHVRERVGFTASGMQLPAMLRFCPICVIEDRRSVGETYWHRVHQITGVEVCPDHAVFLEQSRAPWRDRKNPYRFFSADKTVYDLRPRHLNLSDSHHSILLKISRDAAWLLCWQGLAVDLNTLRSRYYNILLERGYAYYNGRVRVTKLLRALQDFFTPRRLAEIQCNIGSPSCAWPLRIILKDGAAAAQNPIKHLLLMTFLGCTAEEVFTSFVEFKPFGAGPWPCLNRASQHYGEFLIEQSQVTDNLVKNRRGRPEGTFACRCGFVYKRIGPDTSDADRFTYSSVQTYGPAWERLIRRLWVKTELSLQEVGAKLGVSELTVVRHAIRLGLPMNQPRARRVSEKTIERYSKYRDTRQDVLNGYRREWLTVLKAYPHASRQELIQIANFLYLWLRKNDGEWIESHLPTSRSRKTPPRGKNVDWVKVDQELSKDFIAAATHIKNQPGKPTRASLEAVIREIGWEGRIQRYRHRLPLTVEAISQHAESLTDFSIRKVLWAETHYRQVGILPTRAQLVRYAGVFHKTGYTPAVQSAIDATMERISRVLSRRKKVL